MTNLVRFGDGVVARGHATSNLTLASATNTTFVFTDVDQDPHGFFNLGSNASRAVIPTGLGGLYLALFHYRITNTSNPGAGFSSVWYNVNGGGGPEQRNEANMAVVGAVASNWRNVHVAALVIPDGQYVEVLLNQNSGGSEHLAGTTETDYSSRFSLIRLGV